jgi:cytochrome c5
VLKKILIIIIFILSGSAGLLLSLYQHRSAQSDQAIVRTVHYPALFTKKLAGNPAAGKLVYQEFCSACHANQPAIRVHAPSIGDRKTWKAIELLGKKSLLAITLEGKGAMPARGGCFECSDEQVLAAIEYMLSAGERSSHVTP